MESIKKTITDAEGQSHEYEIYKFTGLQGWNYQIRLGKILAPAIKEAITLEGWAAMAAYPWSWTTIVQQMDDEPEEREFQVDPNEELPWDMRFRVIYKKENDRGYFLGIT